LFGIDAPRVPVFAGMTMFDAFHPVPGQPPRPLINPQGHVMGAVNTPRGCRIPVTAGSHITF